MYPMWKYIKDEFAKQPSQMKVLTKLISIGLRVVLVDDEVKIYCDDIEIKPNSLAKALKVDRRVVVEVMDKIVKDTTLAPFFRELFPVANLGRASSRMGFGVIQIVPDSATKPAIISGVSQIIAKEGISIRQVIMDDPEINEDPRGIIVTDSPVPPSLLPEIRKVPGVEAVVIL